MYGIIQEVATKTWDARMRLYERDAMVPLSTTRSKIVARPDFQTLSDSHYDPRLPAMSVATSLSIRETDALLVTTVPTVRPLSHTYHTLPVYPPAWPLLQT